MFIGRAVIGIFIGFMYFYDIKSTNSYRFNPIVTNFVEECLKECGSLPLKIVIADEAQLSGGSR